MLWAIGVLSSLNLALACLPGNAQLPPRPTTADELAMDAGADAPLDRWSIPREARHPGESAFRLVHDGSEALTIRERSAALASRSIDVQTFIWRLDRSGSFLVQRLLEAADRGVRVRMLVDDMDVRNNNAAFAALAAHPNIAVRSFNPFVSRRGVLGLIVEGLTNFERINGRMHNKTWIADNRVAVVGGRNLGDEYFGASNSINFEDLDFAMVGPVVRDISRSFDRYWNSSHTYPMKLLDPQGVSPQALAVLRSGVSRSAVAGRQHSAPDTPAAMLRQDFPLPDMTMTWSANYRFLVDDPGKVATRGNDPHRARVRAALIEVVRAARSEVILISPYFVPGDTTTALLAQAATNGKRVRVLTNSLSATDVGVVHGGYAQYREALLEGGVELWELKAMAGSSARPLSTGLSGASLHSKALLVDRMSTFVGSYNLDPRSAWHNCEQGVLVDSEALALELADVFARQISDQRAWQVRLSEGALVWSDNATRLGADPYASVAQRLQAWIVRLLRLELYL